MKKKSAPAPIFSNRDELVEAATAALIKQSQKWVVPGHFTGVIHRRFITRLVKAVFKVCDPYLTI